MNNSPYADSAQARETDRQSQRDVLPSARMAREDAQFKAECAERREQIAIANRSRMEAAMAEMEVFFGYRK